MAASDAPQRHTCHECEMVLDCPRIAARAISRQPFWIPRLFLQRTRRSGEWNPTRRENLLLQIPSRPRLIFRVSKDRDHKQYCWYLMMQRYTSAYFLTPAYSAWQEAVCIFVDFLLHMPRVFFFLSLFLVNFIFLVGITYSIYTYIFIIINI